MKTMYKMSLVGVGVLALAVLLQDCATAQPIAQAHACPKCKDVIIERLPQVHSPDEQVSYPFADAEWPQVEHTCPDCVSALTSFVSTGKWHHQCALCENTGDTCPSSHR